MHATRADVRAQIAQVLHVRFGAVGARGAVQAEAAILLVDRGQIGADDAVHRTSDQLFDVKVLPRALVVVLLHRIVGVLGHQTLPEAALPEHVARAVFAAPRLGGVLVAVHHKGWPVVLRVPAPTLLVHQLVVFAAALIAGEPLKDLQDRLDGRVHRLWRRRGWRFHEHLASIGGRNGRQFAAQRARRRRGRRRRGGWQWRRWRRWGVRHIVVRQRGEQHARRDDITRILLGSATEQFLVQVELGPPQAHLGGGRVARLLDRRVHDRVHDVLVDPRVKVAQAQHEARVPVEGAPNVGVRRGARPQEEAAVAQPLRHRATGLVLFVQEPHAVRCQQLVPAHDLVALVHGHVVAHVQRVQLRRAACARARKAREPVVRLKMARVDKALAYEAEPREHVGLVGRHDLVPRYLSAAFVRARAGFVRPLIDHGPGRGERTELRDRLVERRPEVVTTWPHSTVEVEEIIGRVFRPLGHRVVRCGAPRT